MKLFFRDELIVAEVVCVGIAIVGVGYFESEVPDVG